MCCHPVVLSIYSGAEEGFKNGEAGYSSLAEAGETHRKVPNRSVAFFLFFSLSLSLNYVVAAALGPAREAFGTTFRHFSDSFLNSSPVRALRLAGGAVQSRRGVLIEGSDVTARVLDLISVTFSTSGPIRDAFLCCYVIVMFG